MTITHECNEAANLSEPPDYSPERQTRLFIVHNIRLVKIWLRGRFWPSPVFVLWRAIRILSRFVHFLILIDPARGSW